MKIIQKCKEENDKLIFKYENLLSQIQKQLEEKEYQINQIIQDNKLKYNSFKTELNKLFDAFTNLINSYRKNKNVYLFEKAIENTKEELDEYNYPNIFKLISTEIQKKIISLKEKGEIKKENNQDKNDNDNKNNSINFNKLTKEKIKDTVLNFDNDSKLTTNISQINNFINSKKKILFTYNKNQLEQLSKEILIKNYLEIITYIKTLEDYFECYKESQENIKAKNINDTIISEYEEKIKTLTTKLDNECQKNNNNLIVINSQKKIIEQFNYKNILNINKTKLNDKYPLVSSNKYCPTISGNKYKDNIFLKSKNYSQMRNSTEKNICDRILGSSEQFNKYKNTSRNNKNILKRPFSSTTRNKAQKIF